MFADMHVLVMLCTAVIFLFMIFVLNSIFYKPLLKFMDQRATSILKDENRVKENINEMNDAGEELEKLRKQTREQSQKIKQEAIQMARAQSEQIIKMKKEELEGKMSEFCAQLSKEKEELKLNLSHKVADLRFSLKQSI